MELTSPKIKITLQKHDTHIPTTGSRQGYCELLGGTTIVFHGSDKVNTKQIAVEPYAKTFVFSGTAAFESPSPSGPATVVSPEFVFLKNQTVLGHYAQGNLGSFTKEFAIPEGTTTIYAPYVPTEAVAMRIVYETLDVTDGVMNLDDQQIEMSRDGATAVFVSTELPTQFSRKCAGYQLLSGEFHRRGVRANVGMTVSQRSPFADPDYTYTPIIAATIDFTSFVQHRDYVEVKSIDATLNQLIKAKGGNDYDIPVSELSSSEITWSDLNIPTWVAYNTSIPEFTYDSHSAPEGDELQIATIEKIEKQGDEIAGSKPYDLQSQTGGEIGTYDPYIIRTEWGISGQAYTAHLYAQFQLGVDWKVNKAQYDANIQGFDTSFLVNNISTQIKIVKIDKNDRKTVLAASKVTKKTLTEENGQYRIRLNLEMTTGEEGKAQPKAFSLFDGDRIGVYAYVQAPLCPYNDGHSSGQIAYTVGNRNFSADTIFFILPAVYEPSRTIPCIDPQVLLQKFLDRMADTSAPRYTATINWRQNEETDYRIRLLAAESVAGYQTLYLHGNLKDFMNWMRVMGYEYEIVGNEIIYRPREQFYTTDRMLDLTEAQLDDLSIAPATDVLYATVKAGYEKQDYNDDHLDGLEANALFQYGTGIEALDGDLDLTSPYRADAIGIQLLYRDPETGETESEQRDDPDEDIFVVVLNKKGDDTVYTEVTLDVYDQLSHTYVKLPNALVSAPYLVRYNAPVIGISTAKLTFTSTTGNKDAKIADVPIGSDIAITEQLFKPILYEFEAGAGKAFPVTTGTLAGCGAVAFTWQGQTLRGFVKEIIRDVADNQAVTWQLYAIDTPTL